MTSSFSSLSGSLEQMSTVAFTCIYFPSKDAEILGWGCVYFIMFQGVIVYVSRLASLLYAQPVMAQPSFTNSEGLPRGSIIPESVGRGLDLH